MRIQLPTGKTAEVPTEWWLGLSDDEMQRFYESDHGSEIDPMEIAIPNAPDIPPGEETGLAYLHNRLPRLDE